MPMLTSHVHVVADVHVSVDAHVIVTGSGSGDGARDVKIGNPIPHLELPCVVLQYFLSYSQVVNGSCDLVR